MPQIDDIKASLALAIKMARVERDVTQTDLERLSGVSQSVISYIELGKSAPKIDTLIKIADGLGKKVVIRLEDA